MLRTGKARGREAAFARVAADAVDRLYATAIRLTRCEADAEDLVQETLLRGLQAFPRIDPTGNVRAYLHRVLVNLYINRYRHRQVVQHVSDLAHVGLLDGSFYSSESLHAWADPHTRFRHANLSARVAGALDSLPPRFREVIVMADMMDFTYAEIAGEMHIPVGTVMSRLFRARRLMRARLSDAAAVPPVRLEAAARRA
jgi:RNA polymerase sigma-70 factor (ECF subfamily)